MDLGYVIGCKGLFRYWVNVNILKREYLLSIFAEISGLIWARLQGVGDVFQFVGTEVVHSYVGSNLLGLNLLELIKRNISRLQSLNALLI